MCTYGGRMRVESVYVHCTCTAIAEESATISNKGYKCSKHSSVLTSKSIPSMSAVEAENSQQNRTDTWWHHMVHSQMHSRRSNGGWKISGSTLDTLNQRRTRRDRTRRFEERDSNRFSTFKLIIIVISGSVGTAPLKCCSQAPGSQFECILHSVARNRQDSDEMTDAVDWWRVKWNWFLKRKWRWRSLSDHKRDFNCSIFKSKLKIMGFSLLITVIAMADGTSCTN